jgi:prevent-host-death family protein
LKLVNLHDAQANLQTLLKDAEHEQVIVEHNGQPVGVILSFNDFQDWAGLTDDELEQLFANPELQAKIQRASDDYVNTKTLSHEEVGARLKTRIPNGDNSLGS